jgi:hypothetical protein
MATVCQYLATGESTTVESRMPAGKSASCKGPALALVSISCNGHAHHQGNLQHRTVLHKQLSRNMHLPPRPCGMMLCSKL